MSKPLLTGVNIDKCHKKWYNDMMMYQGEGIRPTPIPMTPDSSVLWQQYDATSESRLYRSDSCPAGLAEAVLYYANIDRPELPRLGQGGYRGGIVFELDGYALKMTPAETEVGVAGLSTIRANVALHHGLHETNKPAVPVISPYRYKAPELYAAVLPLGPAQPWERVVSVMDIAYGDQPASMDSMPSAYKKRNAVYAAAFRACGLDPSDVFTDDSYRNMKLAPGRLPFTVEVTKFDVVATRQYDW